MRRVCGCVFLLAIAAAGCGRKAEHAKSQPAAASEGAARVVSVAVHWPGASAEEVEQSVTLPMEEAIGTVPGLTRMTATTEEGRVEIRAVFPETAAGAVMDVKAAVDAVRTLPADVERPVVSERRREERVALVPVDRNRDAIVNRIRGIPGVTRTQWCGDGPEQTVVELDPRQAIPVSQVVGAIEGASIDLPGGEIHTQRGEFLVRVQSEPTDVADLPELIIGHRDGAPLRLADVATVRVEAGRMECRCALAPGSSTGTCLEVWSATASADEVGAAVRAAIPETVLLAGVPHAIWEAPAGSDLAREWPTELEDEKPTAILARKHRVERWGPGAADMAMPGLARIPSPGAPGVRTLSVSRGCLDSPDLLVRAAGQTPMRIHVVGDSSQSRPELTVNPDASALARLGLRAADVAEAVRNATEGAEIARPGHPIRVRMGTGVRDAMDAETIREIPLTVGGRTVPLAAVASITLSRAPSKLLRRDGMPIVGITVHWPEASEADWGQAVAAMELPAGCRAMVTRP